MRLNILSRYTSICKIFKFVFLFYFWELAANYFKAISYIRSSVNQHCARQKELSTSDGLFVSWNEQISHKISLIIYDWDFNKSRNYKLNSAVSWPEDSFIELQDIAVWILLSTSCFSKLCWPVSSRIAQFVEHFSVKPEVLGSTPGLEDFYSVRFNKFFSKTAFYLQKKKKPMHPNVDRYSEWRYSRRRTVKVGSEGKVAIWIFPDV